MCVMTCRLRSVSNSLIALLLLVLYAVMIIPSSAYVLVVDRKDVHAMTWGGMGLWLLHSPVEAVFDIAIATDRRSS